MRKTIFALSSLLLVAGGIINAGASQVPVIESDVAHAPTIAVGGSEFFPVTSYLVNDGSFDMSGATLVDDQGKSFNIGTDSNLIKGVTHTGTYYLEWSDSGRKVRLPYIMIGPMNVGHINFATGSAKLDSGDKQVLNAIAKEVVRTNLTSIYLVGRADPVGTGAGNFALSLKRVTAAKAYLQLRLQQLGVSDAYLHIEYMGDITAIASPNKASAADRRVDLMLYPTV